MRLDNTEIVEAAIGEAQPLMVTAGRSNNGQHEGAVKG
jgi:hypothetical protein